VRNNIREGLNRTLEITAKAKKKVNNAILLTGCARNGTTIMGKIIHSFELVEHVHEPPMLFSLVPLIDKMPREIWKLLYETYLYEEFLINAVSGRAINCNKSDDSSIYRVKTFEDVERRLEKTIRKNEAEKKASECVIFYKMPDIVPFVPKICEYYPGLTVVIMKRDAVGVLNSIIAKGWFSQENEDKNLVWPFKRYRGSKVPFWVDENDMDLWISLSEIDRCAYYYIRSNAAMHRIPSRIEISYEQFVGNPERIVLNVSKILKLTFGKKTRDIIRSVSPTKCDRNKRIVDEVCSLFRDRVKHFSEISQKSSSF
jgi:hypothetical protein